MPPAARLQVRKVRVVLPGLERRALAGDGLAAPFHPAFLKDLERFSTLRFMDLAHTNNNGGLWDWDQRPLPEDRSATAASRGTLGGMSAEHQILLANTIGARPWFCIPHNASVRV